MAADKLSDLKHKLEDLIFKRKDFLENRIKIIHDEIKTNSKPKERLERSLTFIKKELSSLKR